MFRLQNENSRPQAVLNGSEYRKNNLLAMPDDFSEFCRIAVCRLGKTIATWKKSAKIHPIVTPMPRKRLGSH
jgi:hypothetical protein